jgi:acyl-CoA reductase-like NAD-dependent aldehyde dehydrogenase
MSSFEKYLSRNPIALRINGESISSSEVSDVVSPYSGAVVGRTHLATTSDIDVAVAAAKKSLSHTVPVHVRAEILDRAAEQIKQHREDFACIIASEAAKPIKTARIEVDRAIQTFLFSASAARTFVGEVVNLDAHPSGENKTAYTLRSPIGVVAAISPFNFPLNLVAHKVAPAIAAGCPVVLKPAHNTPLSSAALVDLLIDECGLPAEMLSYVPCPGDVAQRLSEHEDVAMISFTGSPGVGWSIRAAAPKKKVALELGNNAPVIVCADADLEKVSSSVAASGYSFQGQSCISVQRVYVHESVHDAFVAATKKKVEALVVGDPLDDSTDVSALISSNETGRVSTWVEDALSQGAQLITGGSLDDNGVLLPTLLSGATDDMDVCRKEVFGPVVSVLTFTDLDDALARANDSSYGLQASIFTSNIADALKAARQLNFGGVLINETPTYRADNMPYGGLRDSGNTREGPAYTIREMTEEKLVIINES